MQCCHVWEGVKNETVLLVSFDELLVQLSSLGRIEICCYDLYPQIYISMHATS